MPDPYPTFEKIAHNLGVEPPEKIGTIGTIRFFEREMAKIIKEWIADLKKSLGTDDSTEVRE